ncbi:MAG: TRAP transporter large permease [SAR324 cluster bacterium]|nr:TRAP transporter large permease [SAR324 cluster bacterium]
MPPIIVGLIGVVALLVIIALRAPLGLALLGVGFTSLWYLHGWDTALYVASTAPVTVMSSHTLSVLPLFIFMGAISVRSGLAESLYNAAYGFVGHRRGGLAIASIAACAGFGAICGSSLATVSTMGRIAVPQMKRYGYDRKLAAGSVATGGTLGILIPPSLPMIIYAMVTETSIGKLFAAGLIPGIIATLLYIAVTAVWTYLKPDIGPAGKRLPWSERFKLLFQVWGVVGLFIVVMGGILTGIFSPTEGAAVGAMGATVLGLARFIRDRTYLERFFGAVKEAIQTSVMIFFAVIGISVFEYFLQAARVPQGVESFISSLNFGPFGVMALLLVVLILLGCFLDSIAILFIITPVIFPIVVANGFDPIWFGIIMIMVVEFGLVTPPIGMNVFLLSKLLPDTTTWEVFLGVLPYLAADFLRLAIFLAFPAIVLWLPSLLFP